MQKAAFKDQLGREITILFPPKRIISLVPSQTELLFDLGLDDEIIGITKFCIHPADQFKTKTKIGGTKQLNLEKIYQLNPDLIIGNKEENEKNQIEVLMQNFPVWMSDVKNLDDAFKMIVQIGSLVGRPENAERILNEIKAGFAHLNSEISNQKPPVKVAYFIWKDPYMVAAQNTFINEMLKIAGWQNAFDHNRYPEVTAENIKSASLDVIMLSSEPYPFKEKHMREFKELCPDARVLIVDGELFSWYGSRLRFSPEYLIKLTKIIRDECGY